VSSHHSPENRGSVSTFNFEPFTMRYGPQIRLQRREQTFRNKPLIVLFWIASAGVVVER